MCGILGYHHKSQNISEDSYSKSLDSLMHRGPDESGTYNKGNLWLGHRRLSIIDLEHGHQPMASSDGRYIIVFNGEIYNYKEVARKLCMKDLQTTSDTEVLLYAYAQKKEDCLKYLRGMFAFSVFDTHDNTLFIARDHFGIKPLVYYLSNEVFAFSSEISALKKLPDCNTSIDFQSLDIYLRLNYIPAPNTAYKEIRKLKPGHYLKFNLNDRSHKEIAYYRFDFKPDYSSKKEECFEEFESIFQDSVIHHTYADVPFGAFLSGGIDSTSITMEMSKYLGKGVKTFTIDFEGDYSELQYAKEAAERFGLDHEYHLVKPEAINILDDIIEHSGEPFGDSAVLPTFYLSKVASNSVKMILSGDGADEFLAGYNSYFKWLKRLNGADLSYKQLLIRKLSVLKNRKNIENRTLDKWLKYTPGIQNKIRKSLWRDAYRDFFIPEIEDFLRVFSETKSLNPIQQAQTLDIKFLLQGNMLPKVDIASMMNSLEVRTPFVDIEIANFISRTPAEYYFQSNGKEFEGKIPLRKLLSDVFPENFLNRPKHGFTVPLTKWFNNDSEFVNLIQHYFYSESSSLTTLFEKVTLNEILNEQKKDKIWSLLILGKWLDNE